MKIKGMVEGREGREGREEREVELTKAQFYALNCMRNFNAWLLLVGSRGHIGSKRVTIETVEALVEKGLIAPVSLEISGKSYPRNQTAFDITKNGIEFLDSIQKGKK